MGGTYFLIELCGQCDHLGLRPDTNTVVFTAFFHGYGIIELLVMCIFDCSFFQYLKRPTPRLDIIR